MFWINLSDDDKALENCSTTMNRLAIRCVSFKGDKLLLVRTNKGDLKFPGGGANEFESHSETLAREVLEETGYKLKDMGKVLGEAIETRFFNEEKDVKHIMKSVYYLCEVDFENMVEQELDEYEKNLGFEVVFFTIDEALEANEKILNGKKENINFWVEREVLALKELIKMNFTF